MIRAWFAGYHDAWTHGTKTYRTWLQGTRAVTVDWHVAAYAAGFEVGWSIRFPGGVR
jgi:hypothetical protein